MVAFQEGTERCDERGIWSAKLGDPYNEQGCWFTVIGDEDGVQEALESYEDTVVNHKDAEYTVVVVLGDQARADEIYDMLSAKGYMFTIS